MKKVLVVGASGMVGSRFVELYRSEYELLTPESGELNLLDKAGIKYFIEKEKPNVVVNFAAYTNVSEAENQRGNKNGDCWKINVEGVRNLLDAVDPEKTQFIQISTDMVFSGLEDDPGPYKEGHLPETDSDKLTWYGYAKAEAERLIEKKLGDRATILRIIYPVRKVFDRKLDYLRAPLAKFKTGKLYPLFSDQQVSITFIDEACETLGRIVEGNYRGIFHASSIDITTPYELISKYISRAEGRRVDLESRPLGNLAGRYPPKGGLDVKQTERALDMKFSTTDEIIDKLLE